MLPSWDRPKGLPLPPNIPGAVGAMEEQLLLCARATAQLLAAVLRFNSS